MAGLIPFNRKNSNLTPANAGTNDFYNMLDDFFNDSWMPGRSLMRDTFKIDIQESDKDYLLEAELPGVKKEEIELSIDNDNLCITVKRSEEINKDSKNYVHRERREGCMSRRIHLAGAKMEDIKAKLNDGVLSVTIPKDELLDEKRRIEIE